MAVKRQLKSTIPVKPAPTTSRGRETKAPVVEEAPQQDEKGELIIKEARKKRGCQFCENKTLPHYWDSSSLRRFLNDRARIYPRSRSGTCAKHQRALGKEIKYARHLAILPFKVSIH